MTKEVDEMSARLPDSPGDTLSVLRTLIDGVRGMGIGDPDSGDRVEASDIVRWAVEEIEQQRARLRLTDEEREAIADAAGRYVEGITPMAHEYTATLRGLLERTQ